MAEQERTGVLEGTGEIEQLTPGVEQVVSGEPQVPSRPPSTLVPITEAEKRTEPLPVAPRPPLPSTEEVATQQAQQALYGIPVVKLNRYEGTDQDWVELVRWDIPLGFTGDLHEISLLSDNDEKTRYHVVIGNIDQKIPTDRQTSTPVEMTWRRTVLPGGTSVYVGVRTTDGTTSIIVDAMITGSVR
ncbi:hypothetical protein ES703_20347 [subsurface metagenome]